MPGARDVPFDGGPPRRAEEPWWAPFDSPRHAIADRWARRMLALALLVAWGAFTWALLARPIGALLARL